MKTQIHNWIIQYSSKNQKQILSKEIFTKKVFWFLTLVESKTYKRKHAPRIHSKTLKSSVGAIKPYDYRTVVDCAYDLGWLVMAGTYVAGLRSMAYKLTPAYFQTRYVTPFTSNYQRPQKNLTPGESTVLECLRKLKVSKRKLRRICSKLPISIPAQISAFRIKEGLFYAQTDRHGRIHHNLMQVKKELRKSITLSNKPLYEVDIAEAQPFLLLPFLQANRLPVDDDYTYDVTNRNLYAKLEVNCKNLTTEKIKKQVMMKVLFAKTVSTKKNYQVLTAFQKLYPLTYQSILVMRTRITNKGIAHELQRLESVLMSDAISDLLNQNPTGYFLRFHDAIICEEEQIENIKTTIQNKSIELFGIAPMVKGGLW